jgi:hypothetical protein
LVEIDELSGPESKLNERVIQLDLKAKEDIERALYGHLKEVTSTEF